MLDCSQYDYDEFGCALLKPNCEYIQESGTCYLKEDPCLAGRTSTGACNRITNAEGQKLCAVRDTCNKADVVCDPRDKCCLEGKSNTAENCALKDQCTFNSNCRMKEDPCAAIPGTTCGTFPGCMWIGPDEFDGYCLATVDPCEDIDITTRGSDPATMEICRVESRCEQQRCPKNDTCCPITDEFMCTPDKGCGWQVGCHLEFDECSHISNADSCNSNPSCRYVTELELFFEDDDEGEELPPEMEVLVPLLDSQSKNCTCKDVWVEPVSKILSYGCTSVHSSLAFCETQGDCGIDIGLSNSTKPPMYDTCALPECFPLYEAWQGVEATCAKLTPGVSELLDLVKTGVAPDPVACAGNLTAFLEIIEISEFSESCTNAIAHYVPSLDVFQSLAAWQEADQGDSDDEDDSDDEGDRRRRSLLQLRKLTQLGGAGDLGLAGQCRSIENYDEICQEASDDPITCKNIENESGNRVCKVANECVNVCGRCQTCSDLIASIPFAELQTFELPDYIFQVCMQATSGDFETCEYVYDVVRDDPTMAYKPNLFCQITGICPSECSTDVDMCYKVYDPSTSKSADYDKLVVLYDDIQWNNWPPNITNQTSGEYCFVPEQCDGEMNCDYTFEGECETVCTCDPYIGYEMCSSCPGKCSSLCDAMDTSYMNDGVCDLPNRNTSYPASPACNEDFGEVCTPTTDEWALFMGCDDALGVTYTPLTEIGKGYCKAPSVFMVNATLGDFGDAITLKFSAAREEFYGYDLWYPCEDLFGYGSVVVGDVGTPYGAQCQFVLPNDRPSEVDIYLGYGATIKAGDEIVLGSDSNAEYLPFMLGYEGFDNTKTVNLANCKNCILPAIEVVGPDAVGANCQGDVLDVYVHVYPTEFMARGMALTFAIATEDASPVSETLKALVEGYSATKPFDDTQCQFETECQGFVGTAYSFGTDLLLPGDMLESGKTYIVSVTGQNFMGTVSASHSVQRLKDPVPVLNVIGSATKSFKISQGVKVEIGIDKDTACDQVSFNWSFVDPAKTFRGLTSNRLNLRVPPRAPGLVGGETYPMRLTATTLAGSKSTLDITLKTIASPLIPILSGPNGDFMNDKTLVLTGSSSIDPDDPTDSNGSKRFKWSCSRSDKLPCFTGKQAANNNGTHYIIEPTMAAARRRLQQADSNTRTLVGGVKYQFTLVVSKDTRTATDTLVVPVIEASVDIPTCSVKRSCPTAVSGVCPTQHNPDRRLVLETELDDKTFIDVNYAWFIVTGTGASLTETPIAGVGNTPTAIVSATLLESGLTQEFLVKFSRTVSGVTKTSSASIRIKMNAKPTCQIATGCVTVTPTTGIALGETKFTLEGKGFQDDDTLEYVFGRQITTSTGATKKIALGKSSVAKKVFDSLSAGTQALYICARDTMGSQICGTATATVQVKEVKINDTVIASLDKEIEDIQKSGNNAATIEVATKIAQTYKQATGTTMDEAEKAKIKEKNENLAAIAKNALSVTSTTDIAEAKEQRSAVTELVSGLVANEDTASGSTVTSAVDTLEASMKMGDLDDDLIASSMDVLSQALSLSFSVDLAAPTPAPAPAPTPTTPAPAPDASTPDTPAPAPTTPTTPAPAPAPPLQTVSTAEAQAAAKLKETTESTINAVQESMVKDFVIGLDPPKVVSTDSFDIIGSKDDMNTLAGKDLIGAARKVGSGSARRRLLQDTATDSTQFKVKFSDDFGTKCSDSSKCPDPLTNKVTYMEEADLLVKAIGGLESVQTEPGVTGLEVISGSAEIFQNRIGVLSNGADVNMTFPVTNFDANKKRSCMLVDTITGDLVGYTSEVKAGWTTCPRGYPEPCTNIVNEDTASVTCQSQSMGEYLIVQYTPPSYPPPPPPSPPPPAFNFDEPTSEEKNPPPPPPPPSVVEILSGGSGGDDTLIAIGGAVGGFVVLCAAVALGIYMKKIKKQKQIVKETKKVDVDAPVTAYGGAQPTAYPPAMPVGSWT